MSGAPEVLPAAAAALATACERFGISPHEGHELLARVVAIGPARLPAIEALDRQLRNAGLDLSATLALVAAVRDGLGEPAPAAAPPPPPPGPSLVDVAAPYGPEASLEASVESLRAEIRRLEPA